MQTIQLNSSRYRYVSHLETGSDSEVFCARVDGVFGFEKLVAVKRLPDPRPEQDEARMRLIRHAVICSKLSHHNIVGVYDFYQDEAGLCLAMEMVEGASLDAIIRRQREIDKPIAISTILSVASQLLEVLNYIHHARDPLTRKPLHLVHRDLKPKSIMVDRAGVVKLLGFGRAQCAFLPDTVPLWDSNYVAPEVGAGNPADPSADVFSVGAILYEMMTLKPLFSSPPSFGRQGRRARLEVEAWIELLPRPYQALRTILLRAVALSTAERYGSAARMSSDLRPFVVPTTRSLPPDLGLRLAAAEAMPKKLEESLGKERLIRPEIAVARTASAASPGPDNAVEEAVIPLDEESAEDDRETEVGPVARLSPRALSGALEAEAGQMEHNKAAWGDLVRPEEVPEGEGPVARPAWTQPRPEQEVGAHQEATHPGDSSQGPGLPDTDADPGDETDIVEAETLEARRSTLGDTAIPSLDRGEDDSHLTIEADTDAGDGPANRPRSETLSTVRDGPASPAGEMEDDSVSLVFEEGPVEEREANLEENDEEADDLTRKSSLDELEATREGPYPFQEGARGAGAPRGREDTVPSSYHRALVNIAQEYATAKTPGPDGIPVSPNDTIEAPVPDRAEDLERRKRRRVRLAPPSEQPEQQAPLPPGSDVHGDPAPTPQAGGAGEVPPVSARVPYKDTLELPLPSRSGLMLLFVHPHPGVKCVVPQTGLTIGRSPANDLVIGDHRVAWRHARIEWSGGRWWMKTESPASLRVDGMKADKVPLEPGQLIQIGGAKVSVLEEESHQPGAIIDYTALTLDLVARFRHLILDASFRERAGLHLDERVLRAPPAKVWKAALDSLRQAESVPGLIRLLDAVLEVDPDARLVQESRACLERLEMSVPPVADPETETLSGRPT